jgi:hypothetical protein
MRLGRIAAWLIGVVGATSLATAREDGADRGKLWQLSTGGVVCGRPAVGQDGNLYVPLHGFRAQHADQKTTRSALWCVSPQGKRLWTRDWQTTNICPAPGGGVFALPGGVRLVQVTPNGETAWDVDLLDDGKAREKRGGVDFFDLLPGDGGVYLLGSRRVGSLEQAAVRFVSREMRRRWEIILGPRRIIKAESAARHPRGFLIVGLLHNEICTIDGNGKVLQWLGVDIDEYAPVAPEVACGADGRFFVCFPRGWLTAFDGDMESLGAFISRERSDREHLPGLRDFDVGRPLLCPDGSVAAVVDNHTLVALAVKANPGSGELATKWEFRAAPGCSVIRNPLLLSDGSMVFVVLQETGGRRSWFYRISVDGRHLWRAPAASEPRWATSLDRKVLYACWIGGGITAFNPLLWPVATQGPEVGTVVLASARPAPSVIQSARYDRFTRWPAGFRPEEHGARLVE